MLIVHWVTVNVVASLAALGVLPAGDGATVYPVFQFRRRDGKVEILPELLPILTALNDQNAWAVAVLLNTAAPELDDATPVEWARRGGDADRLAELAGVLQWERSGV